MVRKAAQSVDAATQPSQAQQVSSLPYNQLPVRRQKLISMDSDILSLQLVSMAPKQSFAKPGVHDNFVGQSVL